jgi:hypothetical protein
MEISQEKTPAPIPESVSVETLSPEEAELIFERTEIHGDSFNGNNLTSETLRNNGLLPKYRIMVGDGITLFVSSPYNLARGRIGVVAYVEKNGKTVARSYYRSNSQGVWRYLPNYTSTNGKLNWYGKGYGEESITLPIATQFALANITRDSESILTIPDPESVFVGTARYVGGNDTYKLEVESEPRYLGNFPSHRGEKILPDKIKLLDEQSPNFALDKVLAHWTQSSQNYGDINVEVLPSVDGKLKFIFCRDHLNRVWIGGIEDDSEIQSTGLKHTWVNGGALTTPAYEYTTQAGIYGNYDIQSGKYVDMFKNYLSKVETIRAYCESRSIAIT